MTLVAGEDVVFPFVIKHMCVGGTTGDIFSMDDKNIFRCGNNVIFDLSSAATSRHFTDIMLTKDEKMACVCCKTLYKENKWVTECLMIDTKEKKICDVIAGVCGQAFGNQFWVFNIRFFISSYISQTKRKSSGVVF